MKIKHYIVTYNNNNVLEKCISSIYATSTDHDRQIFVIANHSSDHILDHHDVTILRNTTRPDFSTGHLARNWNQALINGFVNLNNPDADIVICSQNDAEFSPNYIEPLIALHQKYDMITYGGGDNCVSYAPNAVKKVGLWDERFCNIQFQEADYFLRALLYLGDKLSVNDYQHSRLHNQLENAHSVVAHTTPGVGRNDPHHRASHSFHNQSLAVFQSKWGDGLLPHDWKEEHFNVKPLIDSYILYPYFELAVETLMEQRYLMPK